MLVVKKHYIKKYVSINNNLEFDYVIFPISNRNPLSDDIYDSSSIIGFQFFDISTIILDSGESFSGEMKNFSPIYYYGKRFSKEEVDISKIKFDMDDSTSIDDIKSIIKCDCGAIIPIINNDDMTMDEYQDSLLNKNKTKKMWLN